MEINLKLDNVSLILGEGKLKLIHQINMTLEPGIHCLLGPNGSGKTLTNRMVSLIEKVTEGEIKLGDEKINPWSNDETKLQNIRKIGYMRQQPIFLNDNVKNNILLPLKLRKVSKENQIRKINMVLDDYELSDIAEMNINELSVGQQQKVALARTMITEPEIVILDEPTNSLDMKNTRWFEDKIKLLIEKKSMIILWTSHDMNQVRRIAKYCSVIIEGEIRESGLVVDIFENAKDELVRIYLSGELI